MIFLKLYEDYITEAIKTEEYVRTYFEHIPEYVFMDYVYPMVKSFSDEKLEIFSEYFEDYKWILKKDFDINFDILSKSTVDNIKKRAGGKRNPLRVPDDRKRHQYQKEYIKTHGIPTEPIIMVKTNKYHLVEGYHRVIQLFEFHPKGFIYPYVWIGIKK